MINRRYSTAQKWYNDSVILLLVKRKLYTYYQQKLIRVKSLKYFQDKHINYLILDNLAVYQDKYDDNNYNLYYVKQKLGVILHNITYNIRKELDNHE